jgi:hypothetical protein
MTWLAGFPDDLACGIELRRQVAAVHLGGVVGQRLDGQPVCRVSVEVKTTADVVNGHFMFK